VSLHLRFAPIGAGRGVSPRLHHLSYFLCSYPALRETPLLPALAQLFPLFLFEGYAWISVSLHLRFALGETPLRACTSPAISSVLIRRSERRRSLRVFQPSRKKITFAESDFEVLAKTLLNPNTGYLKPKQK